MRPICWLHISDFHMRKRDAWSLDIVLKALCESIAKQRKEGAAADFILATGDLAFSGQADEYKLVVSLCRFFHCGHLHEPEARTAGFSASGCLMLAAGGASFETRQSHNSYSLVTVDSQADV
jgi:3',5'-cyclic AMP phosphodiesterase CpdA